jgi:hypothetical protein
MEGGDTNGGLAPAVRVSDRYLASVSNQRTSTPPPRSPSPKSIKARQQVAGKFGFVLGCIAAIAALAINLWRSPKPLSPVAMVIAVLMSALNVPLGIAFGLLGERMTRRKG